MAGPINYATQYSQALAQAYPYVLHFAALRSTENDARYKWTGAKTVEIPSLSTTGRTDGDRDSIGVAKRNYENAWEPKTLGNYRQWSTLVHPLDIDETNQVASIQNITKVFNEEQKFPEMDAYLVSKLYADWVEAEMAADTTEITEDNIPSLLNAVYQMIVGLAHGIYQGIIALFTGGDLTSTIDKQLEGVTEGFESAASGADDLADSTEKAGKAAKKYLAGFDEITKIGKDSASGAASFGGTSVGTSASANISVGATFEDGVISSAVQAVVEKIRMYFEPLQNIDFEPLKSSISSIGTAFENLLNTIAPIFDFLWFQILMPLAEWTIEEAAPQALETLASGFNLVATSLRPLGKLLNEVYISLLRPMAEFLGGNLIVMLQEFRNGFDKVAAVFEEKGPQIDHIVDGIGVALDSLWRLAEPILRLVREQWQKTAQSISDFTAQYVGVAIDTMEGIVIFLEGVFTDDWERAWDGIVQGVKAPINLIIGFVNGMIAAVVDGINTVIKALNKVSFDVPNWVPGIGGETWGFDIEKIKAPEIPYLARGAVIPPNAPFMAVLGDQRHGTNIEAPLSTIQEAVALVMEDFAAANMAGQEAIIEVLRDILQAVLGIEVGDDVIGNAVERYQRKMLNARGEA